MLKKTTCMIVITVFLFLFCGCSVQSSEKITDADIEKLFTEKGFTCEYSEFQKGRSENLPLSKTIMIIKIDQTELFILRYDSAYERDKAAKDFKFNPSAVVVYQDEVLLVCYNANKEIKEILTTNFTQAGTDKSIISS